MVVFGKNAILVVLEQRLKNYDVIRFNLPFYYSVVRFIMSNSDYDAQLKKFLIPLLRRKSLYWPGRNEAFQNARKERGFYECANCKKLYGRKELHADHIDSVISTKDAWQGWDVYIKRLLVPASHYQILCVACHSSKTLLETNLRKINKKKSKKKI